MKKFFAVIGNPPYHETVAKIETQNGQKRVSSIFHNFQIEADKISENTELIYPAKRWIHRSGKGMYQFGLKQINDPRLAKLTVFPNAKDVFPTSADISDGISIVLKQDNHKGNTFKYCNIENDEKYETEIEYPGESLLPINPKDMVIMEKISNFSKKYHLPFLSESILSQKLFGIESDYIETHSAQSQAYDGQTFDKNRYVKAYTNDKAGKAGRAKWFVIPQKDVAESARKYMDEWQVVVSSANAGGQKRSSSMEIIDNHSVFGRARVALRSFKTKQEAINFRKYCLSSFIKFTFLLTDESLTSLGKWVPNVVDYTNKNSLIDFDKDLDKQFSQLLSLSKKEQDYVSMRAKEYKE